MLQKENSVMEKLDKVDMGKRLREYRTSYGYTLEVLAEKAKLSKNALSLIELGRNYPSQETLAKLADIYGVPASALLGESANSPDLVHRALQRNKVIES